MIISPDGETVRFKTEPQELFLAEKSGIKPNTVRIIDNDEYEMIKNHTPKKIIIRYQEEIFLRTLTNLHFAKLFGKVIVVFSWRHPSDTDHVHVMTAPDQHSPLSHSMSLDDEPYSASLPGPHSVPFEQGPHSVGLQQEAPIPERFAAITISYGTLALLQSIAHGRTMNMVIRELLDRHMPTPVEPGAHNMAIESTTSLDELSALLLPRTLIQDLGRHRWGKSHAEFIQELLMAHINKMAEERGPLHD